MEMSVKSVETLLKELRLVTAASELAVVLKESKENVSMGWITNLLQREVDARRERCLQAKIVRSRMPELKSLEEFNWEFNPEINRARIEDIASLEFIKERSIVLFLGQPGTGKSHLAAGIGLKAIYSGMTVYWSSLKRLSEEILRAKSRNELSLLFKKILSSDLWIMDDWGVVSLSRDVSEEVFDLLDRRSGSTAMILTSNRDISEWPEVFTDPVLASAAIDRIFDRAKVSEFRGKSYRAEGNKKVEVVKKRRTNL
jgi:DNA replication protein DnaC